MPHEITNPATKLDRKQQTFVTTTPNGLEWASENRKSIIVTVSILLASILLVVAAGFYVSSRAEAASAAFGQAMEIYQSPIDVPGQPKTPGLTSYPSAADRAKAANVEFGKVADKYGMTSEGKNARYFQGITFVESNQPQSAENTLKQVANGWSIGGGAELASLAKLALADLYRSSGRDSQAIDLYNQLTAKPTDAVPAGVAQLQLADLYTAEGKPDQARKIYAQLKDKDPKSAAGLAAAKKLNPGAPTAPGL